MKKRVIDLIIWTIYVIVTTIIIFTYLIPAEAMSDDDWIDEARYHNRHDNKLGVWDALEQIDYDNSDRKFEYDMELRESFQEEASDDK